MLEATSPSPSPHTGLTLELPSKPIKRAPPYIRTSFSPGYGHSKSAQHISTGLSPVVNSSIAPNPQRYSQSHRQRHVKSLNGQATPPPLPLPFERTDSGYTSNKEYSDDRAEGIIRQWRLKRSRTDPNSLNNCGDSLILRPVLPDNPKLWTPAQLGQYLLTALRFKGSKPSDALLVPKPVAQDIAHFVVKYKLTGRAFLRLKDTDLEAMGLNRLWRSALLSSSLELRKSVLKGRIWGFGVDDEGIFADSPPTDRERRIPSTVLERDEINVRGSLPASRVEPSLSSPDNFGRLRSSGYSSPSPSALSFDSDDYPSHRSTRPRAESTSSTSSLPTGRVRAIVRNLERATSSTDDVTPGNGDAGFASGEMTSESEEELELDVARNATINDYGPESRSLNEGVPPRIMDSSELGRLVGAPPSSTLNSSVTSQMHTARATGGLPPLLAVSILADVQLNGPSALDPNHSVFKVTLDDEPNIETLLKEEESHDGPPRATSWGAEAWEGEFPGGTSRRAPVVNLPVSRNGVGEARNIEDVQDQAIKVRRAVWDDLCRRLEESERKISLLQKQLPERKNEPRSPEGSSDDHDAPKPLVPGGFSTGALPPCLVLIGVGICALVVQYVFGRVAARRSHN